MLTYFFIYWIVCYVGTMTFGVVYWELFNSKMMDLWGENQDLKDAWKKNAKLFLSLGMIGLCLIFFIPLLFGFLVIMLNNIFRDNNPNNNQ